MTTRYCYGVSVKILLAMLLSACALNTPCAEDASRQDRTDPPAWRGKRPGTAWLGPDILWRSRDQIVVHLLDDAGTGFRLDVDVRDMNTYCEGERPGLIMIIGPSGNTLAMQPVPDDGIVSGNIMYHDGIPDVFMDFRYRGWHYINSPGGYPPGKQRSPFLKNPERVFPRRFSVNVRADGKGIYRAILMGSWDHWWAVTPDRPLATGIHPGPGPLYVHGDRLKRAFFYAPPDTKDIGIMLSEEIMPFNWTAELLDESGARICATEPKTALNFAIHRAARGDTVYSISALGTTTGACLHINGVPALFCPDPETARRLRGGVTVDRKGRTTYFGSQRKLLEWVDSLTEADLNVAARSYEKDLTVAAHKWDSRRKIMLSEIPKLIAAQDTDPSSKTFGRFTATGDTVCDGKLSFYFQAVDVLARAAAWDDPANPYFNDPALIRRVALCRAANDLQGLNTYLWFDPNLLGTGPDRPFEFKPEIKGFFDIPYRSQWVPMHDGLHSLSYGTLKPVMKGVIPDEAIAAWRQILVQWMYGKALFEQGPCSNQWCSVMAGVTRSAADIDEPEIWSVIRSQLDRITTPGNCGRLNPDPTPYAIKSALAYSYAAEAGYTGAGFLADGGGHDNQYCLETEMHLNAMYEYLPHEGIVGYLNDYYVLKSHLTLPKWGVPPTSSFTETASPCDSNFRTRYFTHKSPISEKLRSQIRFGDIWARPQSECKDIFPCLRNDPFIKNIDNLYYFVNTPEYYAILYGGEANPDWFRLVVGNVEGNSLRLVGYSGMHYGGYGMKATKIGGISAVFVRNCGPTVLGWNHNVMYSNTVWGRRKTPVAPAWQEGALDPTVICSGYGQHDVTFHPGGRILTRTEPVPFAPLEIRRTIHLRDDRIDVSTNVIALGDVDLVELYECIPFFVDRRKIAVYDGNFAALPFELPRIMTHEGKELPQGIATGENPSLPEIKLRAFTVAAQNGAGSTVILDREHVCRQTQPLGYGNQTSHFGAFNIVLRPQMKAGERTAISYTIFSHQDQPPAEKIRQVAEDR